MGANGGALSCSLLQSQAAAFFLAVVVEMMSQRGLLMHIPFVGILACKVTTLFKVKSVLAVRLFSINKLPAPKHGGPGKREGGSNLTVVAPPHVWRAEYSSHPCNWDSVSGQTWLWGESVSRLVCCAGHQTYSIPWELVCKMMALHICASEQCSARLKRPFLIC